MIDIGQKVLEQIIHSSLVTATCPNSPESGCLMVWSANASEQISELVARNVMSIESNFTYHPPKDGQPERYQTIREKAKELAMLIDAECPKSREQSVAMTHLETAVFWANAAIARNE